MVQGAGASPWGKSVQGGYTVEGWGLRESWQGHLELALGKHFHHSRVKMISVSVYKFVNLQETTWGVEGEPKREGWGGAWSLCQIIRPLPTGLNKGPPLSRQPTALGKLEIPLQMKLDSYLISDIKINPK